MKTVPRVPLTVVLYNVRSAYNVGAVLRTADVVWGAGVVTCGVTPAADHPKVKKTALGAEALIPTAHAPTLAGAVATLRGRGLTVAAMEPTPDAVSLWDVPVETLAAGVALVFGNEVDGVPPDEARALDLPTWKLPQFGVKTSLNVATAASITLYHVRYVLTADGHL